MIDVKKDGVIDKREWEYNFRAQDSKGVFIKSVSIVDRPKTPSSQINFGGHRIQEIDRIIKIIS